MKNTSAYISSECKGLPVQRQSLENDLYLFEAYLNDHIENEILRMMEHSNHKSSIHTTPIKILTPNNLLT